MMQVPLERDINIAVNGCSGFATSTQKRPFRGMLISRYRGTYLIGSWLITKPRDWMTRRYLHVSGVARMSLSACPMSATLLLSLTLAPRRRKPAQLAGCASCFVHCTVVIASDSALLALEPGNHNLFHIK